MLILTLIDVQYLENVVFTFAKGSNGQIYSSSDSHHPTKKTPVKFSIPPPLNAIWKTLDLSIKKCIKFQVRLPKNHVLLPS